MTAAFNIAKAAILAQEEGWQDVVLEQLMCMHPGEWPLLRLYSQIASGGGSSVVTSLGGFDANDSGKVPEFDVDGSLAVSNSFKIYEGVGHTDYWGLDTSGIDGERDQTPTNTNGKIPVIGADVPVNSAAGGVPGQMAVDNDYLYIFIGAPVNEWRRAGLEAF